ncbi:DNA-binding transcription factor cat8 [Diatrype stigma]|uniref:DNA-binding transcription factor cat8 n=1 Tax=Diatrype stigma TaxID=117547 RepID=A0AAN9UXB1_9PEZI
MPGILPMKVIKVGTSSQSRIAQACDRCRSKKIRCDGIRPCCTQCANVGFECRTSDKLSRRAFPRGYTESLEERVRQLETEIRELKDLLDEKDEKIDMLSKMHDNRLTPAASHASPASMDSRRGDSASPAKEDVFRVQASPLLLGVENSDSYFMGASSGRAFIEAFKRKIQEVGKPCSDFNPEAFLHIQGCYPLVPDQHSGPLRPPPRLFTDRCVNIYFQEWAPLFPVLHKPTFLRLYEDFVADPEKVKNDHKIAQLYLVYSIAALSGESPEVDQIAACEVQWQRALDAVIMNNTMSTLQCLVLAMMYCMIRADYKRLQHYKGIAIGLSHRLGLHQSQKRFSFGALTIETRKKVFWTLYTLDCFSASMLGLPKLLREEDVHAEYPSDTDDEYVTEKGFQPTLPGEYTRLSSALALFRLSRILAQVLERVYPAASTHELSLQLLASMDADLAEWSENLPTHLRLNFVQDKPSTDVTGSRSPILALAYYYIRTLIHRPAVTSSLGSKAATSLLAVGECSKAIVQIVQLLEERNMTFSFCLNKTDVLVLCGITLLYQSLGLSYDSKLVKDIERLFHAVVEILDRAQGPGTYDLKRVATILISVDPRNRVSPSSARSSPEEIGAGSMGMDLSMGMGAAAPTTATTTTSRTSPSVAAATTKKKAAFLHSLGQQKTSPAAMSKSDLLAQQDKLRRMTMPSLSGGRPSVTELQRFQSRTSVEPSSPAAPRRDHRFSISQIQQSMMRRVKTNLDYLSFNNNNNSNSNNSNNNRNTPNNTEPSHEPASPPTHSRNVHAQQQQQQQQPYHTTTPQLSTKGLGGSDNGGAVSSINEWEALLGAMDNGQMYDAIYGGPSFPATDATPTTSAASASAPVDFGGGSSSSNGGDWSPADASWDISAAAAAAANGFSMDDLAAVAAGHHHHHSHSQHHHPHHHSHHPHHVNHHHHHPATQSVPSISDESLSSGDDLASSGDLYLGMGAAAAAGNDDFRNPLLQPPPPTSQPAGGGGGGGRSSHDGGVNIALDGLDLNLGL